MTEKALKQIDRKTRDLNMKGSYMFDNFTDRVIGRGPLGNVLPVVTDALTNVISTPLSVLYVTNIEAQALFCPSNAATGLDIAGDQVDTNGWEIGMSEPGQADARFIFTVGSEPVGFFIEAKFTVADVSGSNEILIGFHEMATVEAARGSYTDYSLFGAIGADLNLATNLASAGETLTDTTDDVSDTVAFVLRMEVDTDGKVTYKMANTAALVASGIVVPTVGLDFTFADGTVLVPCVRQIQDAGLTGTLVMNYLECGYLN